VSIAARGGRARFVGDPELLASALPELERAVLAERGERRILRLGEFQAFYKGSPLRGKSALRHALRRALSLSEIPRLQEFQNLAWLRAHGFLAPRPLLAGVFTRRGLPRFQFLFTELVPDAPPLPEWLERGSREARASALTALARDLARLHALGFVHRDLFPRNLLVSLAEGTPRIVFLDAWRGGPRPGLRGPEHDLGCLFLDGATSFEREEQALILTTYGEEAEKVGLRLPRKWIERVTRARERVFRRERKRRPDSLATRWAPP